MFKKIKELKLKIKIGIAVFAVIFICTVCLSIYSVIKINFMEKEFETYLFGVYSDYSEFKEELGKYSITDIEEVKKYMKENLALEFDLPDGVLYESALIDSNKYIDDFDKYTLVFKLNEMSFMDFANYMHGVLYDLVEFKELGVQSFKDGTGYYRINSFEEATYNNMYFDVNYSQIGDLSHSDSACFRNKMKLKYDENNNTVSVLINHW